VTWTVKFTDVSDPPVSISGQHELAFTGDEVDAFSARYYAELNSVILVYPYVRQLVDDLTSKALGYSVILRPLDVPARVAEYTDQRQVSEQMSQGGSPDASENAR
jgi:preprotein translocase subunit SecB